MKPIKKNFLIDKRAERNIDNFFRFSGYLSLGFITMLLSQLTLAAANPLDTVNTGLQAITSALTGPIARGLALIAVVGLGFAAWSGRLTGGLAVKIIIGIVIIFGAASIVNLFTGETVEGGFIG